MNWSMIRKSKRRFSSALLCVTMVCSMFTNTTSLSVLAAQGNPTGKKLVCEKEEHSHTADCYEPGELSCTLDEEEGHTHDEDCYEETLICDNAEEGHEHTAYCYEKSLICGKEESKGHTHGSKCYEQTLICDTEEHTHNADCYEIVEDTSEPEDTKEPEKEPVKPGDTTESEKETVKPGEITEPEEDTVKPDNTTEPEEDTVKPDKTTEPGKETAIPSDATEKKCTCTSLCTEDEFNADCPVCSEDYTACELAKDADVENDLLDEEEIAEVKALFEAILADYFADRSEENTIAKIVENMDKDTLAACMEQTVDAMNAFDGLTTGECDAFIAENEELYHAIYTELAEALAGRVNNDIAFYAEGYTADATLNKIENTAMAYDKATGIVTITMPDFASTTYTKDETTVTLQFKYDIYVDDDFGDCFSDIGTPTYPDHTVAGGNRYKVWGFGNISSGNLTANGQTQIDLKGVAYTQKIDIDLIACSKETFNDGKPYWYGYAYYVLPNKITYDLNGGNIAGSADAKTEYLLKDDALATTFVEPTREGYAFAGWGTSTSGGTVTAATGVNTTLYAQWKEAPHTHSGYGSDINWTNTTSLPTTAGNYCLTADVSISDTWAVPQGGVVNLDLNGHSITMTGSKTVIYVNGTTLNLYDCQNTGKITGGNGSYGKEKSGGGIYVSDGTFNMYGGSIAGNTAAGYGGGVFVYTNGAFNLYAGTISNNTASMAAGVQNQGTFHMSGGTITGNKPTTAIAGVYNDTTATFTMTGGKITGNEGLVPGAAFSGTVNLNGGEISGNTLGDAYGVDVYINPGVTINTNGTTKIGSLGLGYTTNTAAGKINFTGTLQQSEKIPVIFLDDDNGCTGSCTKTGTFTSIYPSNHDAADGSDKYFVLDSRYNAAQYAIAFTEANELQIIKLEKCTITFDANGGNVAPTKAETGTNGKLASASIPTPTRDGYTFDGWYTEATGGTEIDEDYVFPANTTVYAHWTQKQSYTVSVTASPTAGGTVAGGGTYEGGTAVTVKATANSGYHFVGWKEGEATVSTEAEYTFTASKNVTLTAVFEQDKAKYTVTLETSPTAGGTVTGGGTYEDGSSVTIKATANSGYHFAGWKEGEATVSTEAEYTFTVSKDVELIAVFEKEEGRTQVDVEVDSNAPNTQMNTDKQKLVDSNILTEAEKQQVADGEAAYIRLKVKALSEDSIPLADKTLLLAAAEKLAGAGANLTYIDISLYKQIGNNGAETKVKDILNTKISVTITIPEEIRTAPDGKNRSFYLLRVHEGETEAATINGVYEQSTGAFTFETDRFSTYAIAYKDTPAPDTYYDVKVSSGKAGAGTVTGGGRYQENTSVTVTATANSGYEFVRWTENAAEVSTNANYTFSITGNRDLVAEFKTIGGGSTGGGGSDNSSSSQTPGKHRDGSYDSTFTPSTKESGGTFHGSGNDWTYIKADGTQAKSEWIASGGDWYYFGEDGKMKFDWFLDPKSNLWYMLSRNHDGRFGAALRGWYYEDQDGKWYFLNPVTSEMMTGWQYIDHKRYYFAPSNEGQTYFGDNVNGWYFDPTRNIRPFGSMYRDEETPDGHRVDGNGARVQ